jgi:hypothetical protein
MDPLEQIVDKLSQIILKFEDQRIGSIKWVSVDEYAGILNEKGAIPYLKRLLNPNLPARTQREYINPDDIMKTGKNIKIRYSDIPIKGVSYPRIEKKPLESKRKKDWKAVDQQL